MELIGPAMILVLIAGLFIYFWRDLQKRNRLQAQVDAIQIELEMARRRKATELLEKQQKTRMLSHQLAASRTKETE